MAAETDTAMARKNNLSRRSTDIGGNDVATTTLIVCWARRFYTTCDQCFEVMAVSARQGRRLVADDGG
jgi:hypothetical protein